MHQIVSSNAPAPLGPYSQAVAHGGLLFVSGQIPIEPQTGERVADSIESQAEQALQNLAYILEEGGSSWAKVLRVTVYMTDLREFARFNKVYERMLGGAKPARSTVQVSALPLGARLEIDAIASVDAR